jgi:uncharacterized protein YjbJ (UPF0337 family)
MNEDTLKGKWHQLKGNLRKKWGKLTDDDIDQVHGDAETFLGKLQERYGYARERAERELNEFLSSDDVERERPADISQENREYEGQEGNKRRRVS